MDKKAQIGVGVLMTTFIMVIVGVVLFLAIAQQAGEVTNTVAVDNETISTAITNVSTFYIDYRSITDVVIVNGTVAGEGTIVAANYTVTNNAIDPTDGTLSVGITPATDVDWDLDGTTWRISGTAQPQTYVGGAANSIAALIAIFFALAIAIVTLEPTLRSGVLNMLGK